MDASHRDDLKLRAKVRCQVKIAAAKEEYRATLDGIERVRLLEKLGDASGSTLSTGSGTRRSGLGDEVRTAIREIAGTITSEVIVDHLRGKGRDVVRASVASVLSRLANDPNGEIDTIVAPAGRRAGTYEKKGENDGGEMRIAAV